MGIDPRQLSERTRQLIRTADAASHARRTGGGNGLPLPAGAHAGVVFLELMMTPPTVTHQDKKIGPVAKKGGGFRMTLKDSPALVAARTLYTAHVPLNPGPPIDGPVRVSICFAWQSESWVQDPVWWEQKPDWDNAAKALCDVLAERGYLADDKRIVRGEVFKIGWRRPFVTVEITPAQDPWLGVLKMMPRSEFAWVQKQVTNGE